MPRDFGESYRTRGAIAPLPRTVEVLKISRITGRISGHGTLQVLQSSGLVRAVDE